MRNLIVSCIAFDREETTFNLFRPCPDRFVCLYPDITNLPHISIHFSDKNIPMIKALLEKLYELKYEREAEQEAEQSGGQ